MNTKIKNYDSSFLYGTADYGDSLFQYIIKSDRIDKSSQGFENIRYLVRRNQVTSCISTLLDKASIVLMMPSNPMFRSFKILAAKDIKEDKQTKVFIDVSELIFLNRDEYTITNNNLHKFISLLSCALCTLIYHSKPELLMNNTSIVTSSTNAFAKLSANIIDYMRIGGVDKVRDKALYLSALYYQIGILVKDDTPTVYQKALKVSKLQQREGDVLQSMMPIGNYANIKTFVDGLASVLRIEDALKVDNYVDKWVFLYGSGTQFGTEIFTAFANMLINAYVGAYLNNQNQIEKAVGREMADFCNALFKIGGEVL